MNGQALIAESGEFGSMTTAWISFIRSERKERIRLEIQKDMNARQETGFAMRCGVMMVPQLFIMVVMKMVLQW